MPADEGWDWDGDDWDPAQSLTAKEIAALAALDRENDPAGDWDEDLRDAAPVDVPAWLAGPQPRFQDDEPCSPPRAGPVEALPGLLPRGLGSGGGFDAGGAADRVPPGPVLAGLTADKWAAGLNRADDDELAGLLIAWRRIASWATAGELAAVAELSRRRRAQVASGADPHLAEHVSDEVAMALTLTSWAAGTLVDRADGLARLPKTMAALAAGEIDVPKALVILGELSGLGDVHAARVEAAVIGRAAGWTTGELRRAARRQVFAADPAAARRRKERAEKQARVERWAEDAGTAALAGRDLPPAGVLAADAHLTAWAKRLKAAGLGGNLDQLRARVYLALLNGRPPESLLPMDTHDRGDPTGTRGEGDPAGAAAEAEPAGPSTSGESFPVSERLGAKAGTDEACTASSTVRGQPPGPVSRRRPGFPPGRTPGPPGPSVRGSVNLVLPLSTWLGWSASPGEVTGFGPLDAPDSRALAGALARDPATKWCVTVIGPDGRAAAHGCAKAGPGPPPTESSSPAGGPRQRPTESSPAGGPRQPPTESRPAGGPRQPPLEPAGTAEGPGPPPLGPANPGKSPRPPPSGPTNPIKSPGPPSLGPANPGKSPGPLPLGSGGSRRGPGPPLPLGVRAWLDSITLAWLETDGCSHRRESPGYRPSPSLIHLIQARQVTCTAPGCRRPATSCDFEHTIPYHLGGRSCECNGGPCCRRHHRAKQAEGWHLSQPRPGSFIWTTPHGRSYRTEPEPYPT